MWTVSTKSFLLVLSTRKYIKAHFQLLLTIKKRFLLPVPPRLNSYLPKTSNPTLMGGKVKSLCLSWTEMFWFNCLSEALSFSMTSSMLLFRWKLATSSKSFFSSVSLLYSFICLFFHLFDVIWEILYRKSTSLSTNGITRNTICIVIGWTY